MFVHSSGEILLLQYLTNGLNNFNKTDGILPAFVAEWLTHSAAMCNRAWRAQWPGFDSARARLPTKERKERIISNNSYAHDAHSSSIVGWTPARKERTNDTVYSLMILLDSGGQRLKVNQGHSRRSRSYLIKYLSSPNKIDKTYRE